VEAAILFLANQASMDDVTSKEQKGAREGQTSLEVDQQEAESTTSSFNGSLMGAWISANAVMGYTVVDTVLLEKNINLAVPLHALVPVKDCAEEQIVGSSASL